MVEATTKKFEPDEAKAILERGDLNRPINPARVRKYADAMLAGEWRETSQTIAFDNEDKLIDGQHRLAAVVATGVPREFLVVYGITDPLAQDATDVGARRTAGQQLALRGERYPNELAATLRWYNVLQKLIAREAGGTDTFSYTPVDALRDLEKHPEARESTALGSKVANGGISRVPPRVVGATHFLFGKLDDEGKDDADVFWTSYLDADMRTPRTSFHEHDPRNALRSVMLTDAQRRAAKGGGVNAIWMSAVVIKAWNAWREGQHVSHLKWRRGGNRPEAFPIPR